MYCGNLLRNRLCRLNCGAKVESSQIYVWMESETSSLPYQTKIKPNQSGMKASPNQNLLISQTRATLKPQFGMTQAKLGPSLRTSCASFSLDCATLCLFIIEISTTVGSSRSLYHHPEAFMRARHMSHPFINEWDVSERKYEGKSPLLSRPLLHI